MMSFLSYVSRILVGLPGVESADVIAAKTYRPTEGVSLSVLAETDYDLAERPLDVHTYGAITPIPDAADLMTSEELASAANDVYTRFGS